MSLPARAHAPSTRRWLWLIAGWILFAAVQALLRSALGVRSDISLLHSAVQVVVMGLGWAALTPVIGSWQHRATARGWRTVPTIAWHLPLLVIVGLLVTALRRVTVVLLGGPLAVPFEVTLLFFADLTIASYLVAIWASRALDSFDALLDEERRASALRSQLMTSQMEYLDQQLRPHFLFNALGTIAELAHEAPRTAARMLENVIALLESAVARRGGGLVSLDDELRGLAPYLDIQRLRFADWLIIDLSVDPECRRAFVPPFVLQPLVENAVHHGLLHRTERGHIAIAAHVAHDRLRLQVSDNGAGLSARSYQESRGLGLANIRGRLATFYGAAATLDLQAEPGGGTTASLEVPLVLAAPAVEPHAESSRAAAAPRTSSGIVAWMLARPGIALVLAWSAVALFRIQHSLSYMWLRDRFTPQAFQSAIRYDVIVAMMWLALTPLVIAFSRAVPLRGPDVIRRLGVHVLGAATFAFSHALLTRILVEGLGTPLWQGLDAELYAWNVAVYVVLFLGAHHRTLELWLRDRELTAQRLRAELQEARLSRVVLELRPAMLFDVLRHLVALVESDSKLAERRLVELGDFLRATLDAMRHHEVPLAQELEGARAYARLLGIATVPRLTLRVEHDERVATEPVPNGILRAAIDAVLADHPSAGAEVQMRVRRFGDRLQIATWQVPERRGSDPALTGQITGYLEHGLAEASWNDGQLLLRT